MDTAVLEPERNYRARKIVHSDVIEIARLVAQRCLNETEACHLVGIKPVTWFNWKLKNKNQQRFQDIFTRLRATKIESALERIDNCGDGIGLKQPDWRAKAFMLQAMDRERFGTERPAQAQPQSAVTVMVMCDALNKLLPTPEGIQVKSLSAPVIDSK